MKMNWILVTGAAKGLGAQISLCLAQKGYNLVLHYCKSFDEVQEISQKCRAYGTCVEILQCDFSIQDQLEDFINQYLRKFSQTFALINNVGNYFIGSALATPINEWNMLIQTNLLASIRLMQSLMPSLKATQGSVINIGTAGLHQLKASSYSSAYMMSKSALWFATKCIAAEVAAFNVRVNMVSPGYLERSVDQPKNRLKLLQQREGLFEDITHTILFLLSEESKYITGQNIEVSGGVGL